MRELILFVVSARQRDEDAQVVSSSNHTDVGTSKLGTELVKASCGDALIRTVNVEGRYGRMVRGLFGKVGEVHALIAGDTAGAARGG